MTNPIIVSEELYTILEDIQKLERFKSSAQIVDEYAEFYTSCELDLPQLAIADYHLQKLYDRKTTVFQLASLLIRGYVPESKVKKGSLPNNY